MGKLRVWLSWKIQGPIARRPGPAGGQGLPGAPAWPRGPTRLPGPSRPPFRSTTSPRTFKPLIKETGCHGFCSQGTLVSLYPFDLFYVQVKPADVPEIVDQTPRAGKVVERLLYSDNGARYRSAAEVPFYKLQQKVILKNVGLIDPLDIEDALKAGAYRSLVKALTQKDH